MEKEILKKGLSNRTVSDILHYVAGADVAQQVERILGKDEVTGSIPVISSKSGNSLLPKRIKNRE